MAKLGLGKNVPLLDLDSSDFMEQLNFEMWSTQSSSDTRNDRNRPYDGQSHTDDGVRGQQIVSGLTMRDIKDCLIMAMIESAPCDKMMEEGEFMKCWDFSECKSGGKAKPTQYLLDHIDEPDYIMHKVELGIWRPQDIYKINWGDIVPLAIVKNLTCNIEKMMGIFPNVTELQDTPEETK